MREVMRRNQKHPLPSAFPYSARVAQSRVTTLHSAGCRRIGLRVAAGRRFVFRRALCLHVFGYKAAVVRQTAFHQRLRLVDKSVRQRLAAHIGHRQQLPLSGQNKIHAAGKPLDCPRLNRAADADAMRARGAVQGLQFGDGVVVRLAFAVPQPSEETQRHYDNADANPEFGLLLHNGSQEKEQFPERILAHCKRCLREQYPYGPVAWTLCVATASRSRPAASEAASPSSANGIPPSSRIAQGNAPEIRAGKNCSNHLEMGASLLALSERRIRANAVGRRLPRSS